MAIAALPPFNGFVSEWLIFQAVLLSPTIPQWGLKLMVPAVGALLALSAALAGACFVRAFGMTFLGRPRDPILSESHEVDRFSLSAMLVLAVLCLMAGVLPGPLIDLLEPVISPLVQARMPTQAELPWLTIVPIANSRSSYNGLLVFLFIASSAWLVAFAVHRLASRALRRSDPWDCGFPNSATDAQYTASSFAQPIRRVFSNAGIATHEKVVMPPPGSQAPATFSLSVRDSFLGVVLSAPGRSHQLHRQSAKSSAVPNHPPIPFLCIFVAGFPPAGARNMGMISDFLIQLAQMTLVVALAPLLTGIIRKIKARLTRHRGASVLQPYRDLRRLLRKEVVLAQNASWLFRVAPYLIFSTTWVAAALVPTFATGLLFSWSADLIAITALLGSARFFMALAGLDVGTSFGGIGSSREVMIASIAEPAMLMIVFTVALTAGSTQLATIAEYMNSPQVGLRVSLGLALIALVIVGIAENARIPVDNPATHLELTMVHEAMILEYSGRHLAMIELASSVKLLLYISLIICLFMPWGLAPEGRNWESYAIGLTAYVGKLGVAAFALAFFETSIAKMRVFRVPQFLGGALMLGLLATLLLFVSRGL